VVFRPLSRADLTAIVALQLERLRAMVTARGLTLEVSDEAMAWIGDAGFDPMYGARPLKRVIQRELQNPIAMELLAGNYTDGDTIRVTVSGDRLVFSRAETVAAAPATSPA